MRLAAAALVALFFPLAAAAQLPADIDVLQHMGPPESRIDLVVVAEGYTEEDRAQFEEDASRLTEALFGYAPWSDYTGLVNVTALFVASAERGADRGTWGETRDTAFGATYGCNGIDRLLCVDTFGVLATVATHAPEFDVILVLVNDPKYGGAGGQVAVASLHPLAPDVVVHELAHTLVNLADEYSDPYPGFPACDAAFDCPEPNVTVRQADEELKWAAWIEEGMPLPSPPQHPGVGLFEGARYQLAGVFRPEHDCLMRSYNRLEFCAVCAEAHVRSFLDHTRIVQDFEPVEELPFAGCEEEHVFSVETTLPPDQLIFEWAVGGRTLVTETGEPVLRGWELPEGKTQVELLLTHATDRVRNDPQGSLVARHTFEAEGGACDLPCVRTACDGDDCVREPEPDGTPCGESLCGEGTVTGFACVAGVCEPYEETCAPFACAGDGTGCLTDCMVDDDCAAERICSEGACVEEGGGDPGPGTGGAPGVDPGGDPQRPPVREAASPSGCGCSGGGSAGLASLWALVLVLLRRR